MRRQGETASTGDHVTMPAPSLHVPPLTPHSSGRISIKPGGTQQKGHSGNRERCGMVSDPVQAVSLCQEEQRKVRGGGRWWPQRPGPQGPTSEGLCQPCSGPAPAGASKARQRRKGQEPTGLSLATTVPRMGGEERVWVSPPDARLLSQLSPRAANSQAPVHPTQCLSAQRSLWAQDLPGPHSWTRLLWLMPRGPRQLQLTPALRQSLQKIWSLVSFSSKPFNGCLQGEEQGRTSKTVENLCWPHSSLTPAQGTHRAPTATALPSWPCSDPRLVSVGPWPCQQDRPDLA